MYVAIRLGVKTFVLGQGEMPLRYILSLLW
jgi:hypothetical protein